MTRTSIAPPGMPPAGMDDDYREKLMAFQEAGKTLLNGFFICLRMARLYGPANEALQKPLQATKEKLDEFVASEGLLKMVFAEGQIYINDTRLKVDASSFEWAAGLVDFFTERDMGGLRIEAGQSREALGALFQILLKLPKYQEGMPSPREELSGEITEQRILGVYPLRMVALSEDEDEVEQQGTKQVLSQAVGMYIGGLAALRNLAGGRGGGGGGGGGVGASNMLQMTRVAQSLADAHGQVGGDLLALVTIKNCEHFLLSHAMNVCILSIVMGKMLQLGKAEISDLALGAMLHDIGKFREEEETSESEYQRHPYESFKWIMKGNEVNHSLLMKGLIALDHHVSFDGKKGFPVFRLGQRPHLYARIVSIADAYDCLTTPVADQEALLPDIALRTILKQAGTIFDPLLAQVFVETLGKYPVGTLVELDSGDLGIVLKSGRSELRVTRPVVLLIRDRFGNDIEGGDIMDLTERHSERKAYKSSIVCSHDPARMDINISGYLIDFLTTTAGSM